jgi:hypothetical protein
VNSDVAGPGNHKEFGMTAPSYDKFRVASGDQEFDPTLAFTEILVRRNFETDPLGVKLQRDILVSNRDANYRNSS